MVFERKERNVDLPHDTAWGGRSLLNQFATTPVEAMNGLWEKIKATGLEPLVRGVAERAGFDLDGFVSAPRKDVLAAPVAAAPSEEPSAPAASTAESA